MNEIHPTAIVSPYASLGFNNYIGPFCVIGSGVTIGSDNIFTSHVSVGAPPQHRSMPQRAPYPVPMVSIGSRNTFREFVTIHGGIIGDVTKVGNSCFIMACAHIPHDAIIEDHVTICNNTVLGGHTTVLEGATLGLGCQVHQYQVIGAYAMLGMGTVVPKGMDILPGRKYAGNPAKDIGINSIGLQRNNVSGDDLIEFGRRFQAVKAVVNKK